MTPWILIAFILVILAVTELRLRLAERAAERTFQEAIDEAAKGLRELHVALRSWRGAAHHALESTTA